MAAETICLPDIETSPKLVPKSMGDKEAVLKKVDVAITHLELLKRKTNDVIPVSYDHQHVDKIDLLLAVIAFAFCLMQGMPTGDELTKVLPVITFHFCYWLMKVSTEYEQKTCPHQSITESSSKQSVKLLKDRANQKSIDKDRITAESVKNCFEPQGQSTQYNDHLLAVKGTEIISNLSTLISKSFKFSSDKKNVPDSGYFSDDNHGRSGNHEIPHSNRLDLLQNMNQCQTPEAPSELVSGTHASNRWAGNNRDDTLKENPVVAKGSPHNGGIMPLPTKVVRDGSVDQHVEKTTQSREDGHSTSLASQPSQTRTAMSENPREAYITDSHGTTEHKPDKLLDHSHVAEQLNESDFSTVIAEIYPQFREPRDFTFTELQEVTHNFDSTPKRDGGHRLGQGSFGVVYYGCIQSRLMGGQPQEIAVKKLRQPETVKPSMQALCKKQFRSEIQALSRVDHPNVIQLYGQSSDGPELCLVYEYMPGGTLAQCLAKTSTNVPNWDDRTYIARGIGKALKYLHSRFQPALIHRDVKSSNILLDNSWNPKLADFGLFCMGESEESPAASFAATSAVGTKSYMAPEALKGRVSPKIDVYSYGMILYELVTGLPPYSQSKKTDLIMYMRDMESEGDDLSVMVDPRAAWPQHIASGFLELAHHSTQFDSHERPRMSEIVKVLRKLEGHSQHY